MDWTIFRRAFATAGDHYIIFFLNSVLSRHLLQLNVVLFPIHPFFHIIHPPSSWLSVTPISSNASFPALLMLVGSPVLPRVTRAKYCNCNFTLSYASKQRNNHRPLKTLQLQRGLQTCMGAKSADLFFISKQWPVL